jgi:hypothetical protein
MAITMIGSPGQQYKTRGGTYVAGPNGIILNVANNDIGDMEQSGALPTGTGPNILGSFVGLNMNITTDQPLALAVPSGASYFLTHVVMRNASISLTTAAGGLYTAASKGGTVLVLAATVYTGFTGPTITAPVLIVAAQAAALQTANPIYFSLTTGQGAAATADMLIYGDVIYA